MGISLAQSTPGDFIESLSEHFSSNLDDDGG
jgi:hypothetical protein